MERLKRGVGPRMLVSGEGHGLATPLARHLDSDDLLGKKASRFCRCGALLAPKRECVLICPADAEVLGNVFSGAGHRLGPVCGVEGRIDEPPSHCGVFELLVPAESGITLAHDKRRPGHALHATCDGHVHFAGADRAGRGPDRFEAGRTEAIERHAGHLNRQPGQQQAHPGNVAIVLAGLIGAAIEDLVDRPKIQPWVAFLQCGEWHRTQVVCADFGQRSAVATDGSTDGVANEGIAHETAPVVWFTSPARFAEAFKGRPVIRRSSSRERPSTISITLAPFGPRSKTARSV